MRRLSSLVEVIVLAEIISTIKANLDAAQTAHALTDRALAMAIQLFMRTGEFPDSFADSADTAAQQAIIEAAWLLFVAAPARAPRYLLIASMHLDLVVEEDRDLLAIFDEISALDEPETVEDDQDAPWLREYRALGRRGLPAENSGEILGKELKKARKILTENHDQVRAFSEKVINDLTLSFDRDVREGNLSPLGPEPLSVDSPEEALTKAHEARDQGDLEAAQYLFSIYLKDYPEDVEALVERGILQAALEDLTGALEDFDAALGIEPEHLIARLNRALARHSLGQVEAAIDDYDRAIKAVNKDPEIFTNRGIAHFSAGNYQQAIKDFDRAIELDPSMATAFYQRGNVRRILGEVGHAIKDYEKALSIRPDFVDVLAARGFLHLQLQDTEKAIADFGLAIGLQPSDPALYYNRAYARLMDENLDGAIADYDMALSLDPEDVEALANRGAAHMLKGDLDAAVQDWEEAIAIDPYYPTAYLKRASMWIATEQPDEAARDLQIALDNAPPSWPYRQEVEETLQELLDDLGFNSAN